MQSCSVISSKSQSYSLYHSVADLACSQACKTDKRAICWSALAIASRSMSRSPCSVLLYNVVMPCLPARLPPTIPSAGLRLQSSNLSLSLSIPNATTRSGLDIVRQMYHQNTLRSLAVGDLGRPWWRSGIFALSPAHHAFLLFAHQPSLFLLLSFSFLRRSPALQAAALRC